MSYLITVLVSVVEYYFVCNTDSGYFSLICNRVIRTLFTYTFYSFKKLPKLCTCTQLNLKKTMLSF